MDIENGIGVITIAVCLIALRKRRAQRASPRWHVRPHLGSQNRSIRGQMVSLNTMRIHDPDSFFQTLRFYPEDFDKLLHMVGPYIIKDDTKRETINPSTRLALTLRYLATGESMRSLALNYVIGEKTAQDTIWETTYVIWKVLERIVMPPPNREMLEEIAEGFLQRWDVPNCCGSTDGKLVRIKMPPDSGSVYFCYKGYHAQILLGWCDYRYRFVVVDTGSKGRQSDGGVFSNSRFGKKLKSNQMNLPPPKYVPSGPLLTHFLLGDEAFGLNTYMMTPYPGRSTGLLSYTQQIYNYRQSRGRRVIENTFGIYVATWRIFKTEIDADIDLVDQIVMSTACLHNFRLMLNDERENSYIPKNYLDEERNGIVIPGQWRKIDSEIDQIAPQTGRHSSAEAVRIRNDLAEYFLTAGAVPWQHEMISK